MPTPLFNADDHSYRTPDGARLTSVTQALVQAGIIDTTWYSEAAAWRGSVVHRCCELWDKGKLVESSVDPEAMGYLDAWREASYALGIQPVAVEVPSFHPQFGYAGTPDVVTNDGVFDRKTGALAPWHGLQLAAYAHLGDNPKAKRRVAVQLKPNGRYSVKMFKPQDMPTDWAVFQSALNVAKWKVLHG